MLNIKEMARQTVIGAVAFLATTVACYAIPVTQLGFALDSSGSVSGANYTLQTAGLAAALAAVPVDSTVEITVVDFGSNVNTHVTTVVIDSVATRDAVVATVAAMAKGGGGTNMTGAINSLSSILQASANHNDAGSTSIINLSTDGSPNSQSNATAASAAAYAAGIDALTSEAIGSGANTSFLEGIVFNPLGGLGTGVTLAADSNPPNPLTAANAWVVPVSDFNAYAAVISSKVSAIVIVDTVPVPGTLFLISIGLLGFGMKRRVKA